MRAYTNGRGDEVEAELVIVLIKDEINQALTGHEGCRYESPPQPRQQALTLARVLLGYTSEELDGGERWSCPIAGGRRTIALKPAGDRDEKEDYDGGHASRSAHSRTGAAI